MIALCWYGKEDVRCESVPEPSIINPRDAIVRVTSSAICGSDLLLYNGALTAMEKGDILGHEFVGEVVEVGSRVQNLSPGDRVIVPGIISCGQCYFCRHNLFALCDNSNPNAAKAKRLYGFSGVGMFGYSHLFGGYAGGHAELVRVPFADIGPFKIGNDIEDDQIVPLADTIPTGYMAAENCHIQDDDIIAVWGCGAIGQMAIRCAFLLGANRIIAIDRVPERLALAEAGGAETINFEKVDVLEELSFRTGGRGPDSCIDAVGRETHLAAAEWLPTDRATAFRQAVQACRQGGIISIVGDYSDYLLRVPFGIAFRKGIQIRMGHAHVHAYLPRLIRWILDERLDPTFLFTHRFHLKKGAEAYSLYKTNPQECMKVLLHQ